MPRFKDNDISERREAAANAKKAMLEGFRARRAPDHPIILEQKAARHAKTQRKAAERQAREEEAARLAREQAESEASERHAEAERAVTLLAEQKAARDVRYAARKARRR